MNLLYKMTRHTIQVASCLCVFLLAAQAAAQQASLNGNTLSIPVVLVDGLAFRVELILVEDSNPLELVVSSGTPLTEFVSEGATTFDGSRLSIPSINVAGTAYWADFDLLREEPATFVFVDAGIVNPAPPACTRPEPDASHGSDNPNIAAGWSIDRQYMVQTLAPDAIPAIDNPVFTQRFESQVISDNTHVVGVKIGDDVRAYSHTVLDWHEVVNDQYMIDGEMRPVTLSYCPLTGSAMLWKGKQGAANPTFGVSGRLFNSNLVMYDRETGSYWAQMLEQAVCCTERLTIPDRVQVIETTWGTWRQMYPQTTLLSDETGFSRAYGLYPYGNYLTNRQIIPPENTVILGDDRLHRKERIVGINVGDNSKAYPIANFSSGVTTINDRVGSMDVVAVGSAGADLGAIFNRQLEDCTTLEFSAVQDQLPVVMLDNEGSAWDIFGVAVSGPRAGTQLQKTNSYIAFWFAWAAFFPGAAIHQ